MDILHDILWQKLFKMIANIMISGHIQKMRTELESPVQYYLPLDENEVHLNPYLGKQITMEFQGQIHCRSCGRKTSKSFSQGYCFPCMKKLACCDLCIMKPETCHYFEGTCREPEWGKKNCFTPHYVYLSNTSNLKVGITRHSQIPTRWIDQGATQATIMFEVSTRQQSGFIEMAFKDLIADKTNWRNMLKGDSEPRDLVSEAAELKSRLIPVIHSIQQKFDDDSIIPVEQERHELVDIEYPVLEYPTTIKSYNFDKNPVVSGTLMGIKGQYLMLDTGVINMRKFSSYQITFSA